MGQEPPPALQKMRGRLSTQRGVSQQESAFHSVFRVHHKNSA
jgi:hypothetical protein